MNGNLRASFIFKSFFAKFLNFTCRDENVVKLLKAILFSIIKKMKMTQISIAVPQA